MDNLTKKKLADLESLVDALKRRLASAKGADRFSIEEEIRRNEQEIKNIKNWNR